MQESKLYLVVGTVLIALLIFIGYLNWTRFSSLTHRVEELETVVAENDSRIRYLEEDMQVSGHYNNEDRKSEISHNDSEDILEVNGLVRVQDLDKSIIVDLRYATTDNFTGQKLYSYEICLLQRGTAEKLVAANKEFQEDGYRLKIWDAYRPLSVQEKLWEEKPDERYVAPPHRGSNHNRGAAVDVTLVDEKGEELIMPSGFDEFAFEASRSYPDMTQEARENLYYLTKVMTRNGFTTIESEWWHFNDINIEDYPVLDLSLEEYARKYFAF